MGLQMGGVDHDPLQLAALVRQRGENLVEHPQTAPANEPIVEDAIPSLDCRAWKGRSNPLLLSALHFAPESRRRLPCRRAVKNRSSSRAQASDSPRPRKD